MAMFVRVKRKKTTYFLHCDPSETVLEIKQKLQALSDNPVDCQRLILVSSQLVLEDCKTLADQKVENDAIVALCLKTSDPRVNRISTGMRSLPDSKLFELSKPSTPKRPPLVEAQVSEVRVQLGEDGQPLLPPPSEPVLLQRAMSTLLRTPYKPPPPTPEEIAKKEAVDKEAAKLELAKRGAKENDAKKASLLQDGKGKRGKSKKGTGKTGESNKNVKKGSAGKEAGKKDGGGRKKGKKGKKSDKSVKDAKPAVEVLLPPPDTGVWEDICIDRLTDYATLIDSD